MAIATPQSTPLARLAEHTQRYRSALIVTDFTDTAETFHRWLLHLGRQSAARLCLLHLDGQLSSDDSSAILLEGLRCRMKLSPDHCEVMGSCPLERLPLDANQLVIVGRSQCMQNDSSSGQALIDRASEMGCDVIVIDDVV